MTCSQLFVPAQEFRDGGEQVWVSDPPADSVDSERQVAKERERLRQAWKMREVEVQSMWQLSERVSSCRPCVRMSAMAEQYALASRAV